MKNSPRPAAAFALIATLAILSIVTILVIAFATTARTESSAALNFAERERAQAVGQGMLNRILADHAAPLVGGKRLKPYAVVAASKLPDTDTEQTYNAAVPLPGIYTMQPLPGLRTDNHLVRISKPTTGEGEDAFTPQNWAWSRAKVHAGDPDSQELVNLFTPRDDAGEPISPQWIDYVDANSASSGSAAVPIGEVAYTVWDESGSFDLNLAGPDVNVNGIAPHNLGFEKLAKVPANLLSQLDGRDNKRQRSNFGLREISKIAATNDTGDDRWFFSVEELLSRRFLSPQNALLVTSSSRDFDVRPEWDGDRSPDRAKTYLRSFINNPNLFTLFTQPNAGSHLVKDTLNEATLRTVLSSNGLGTSEDWMQVMRLLASLRLALPPFRSVSAPADTALPNNVWYDQDVFGIALNIIQATAPASDQNLHAYNRQAYSAQPFNDPHTRLGIRVGPYVTETAIKAQRLNATTVRLVQYIELWNPYACPLVEPNTQNVAIQYRYGNWTGSQWQPGGPRETAGLQAMGTYYSLPGKLKALPPSTVEIPVAVPAPGAFTIVRLEHRDVAWPEAPGQIDLQIRSRPYVYNLGYWSSHITGSNATTEESSSYAVSIGPFYTAGGSTTSHNLIHVIPNAKLNRKDSRDPSGRTYLPAWHSFQIDDPRMGAFPRYAPVHTANPPAAFNYSWWGYEGEHSLCEVGASVNMINEIRNDPVLQALDNKPNKYIHPTFGDGFGRNFLTTAPPGINTLARALATFALPRRPFLNVGELGSVFANRPWRTLSFANTTVPTLPATLTASNANTVIQQGSKPENYISSLLDYLTTVGTTITNSSGAGSSSQVEAGISKLTELPFKVKGSGPQGILQNNNVTARKQDNRWLFESVKADGTPDGNLRPVRGKINLNSAPREVLRLLLSAPYRLPQSLGIMSSEFQTVLKTKVIGTGVLPDVEVTIDPLDADLVAAAITSTTDPIRPFRKMADLGKLGIAKPGQKSIIHRLHDKYPDSVVDAMIARLAQFGTVRQQIYTVDMVARSLNRNVEERRMSNPSIPRVVTAEVRFLARVNFDTFSRRAFVESIEYR